MLRTSRQWIEPSSHVTRACIGFLTDHCALSASAVNFVLTALSGIRESRMAHVLSKDAVINTECSAGCQATHWTLSECSLSYECAHCNESTSHNLTVESADPEPM